MAAKNLDAYKLAVVLDASGAAKGISALADADKQASKLDASFVSLGKSAVRGFGDLKKAATDNAQKTQQALAGALAAGKKNVGGLISEARKAQAEFRALEKAEEKALRLASGGFLSRMSARAGSVLPGLSHISNIVQGLPQIGNLAGALLDPLKESAEVGLEFNMLIEEATVGFEGITGGAKQAAKYVKELTDFAADNPIFNTQGTVNGARQMAIFGFETRRTTDYLKVWGGALAKGGQFNDEKLQSIIRGFGQIRQLGTVSAEDMNILQDANIPAWELLAKAIGKTTAETRKLAEARKLNGPAAVDAMTEMLRTDPRFAGGADAFARTTRGRLAQLQDLKEVASGKAMEGTTKELGSTLEAAMMGDLPTLVNRMAAGMDAALTPVSKIISASVKGTLGGGITSGLAEGIDAGRTLVTRTVGDFALDAVISPFKSMLGINSPSTVFAEFGGHAVDGFAYGSGGKGGLASEESKQKLRKALEELANDPRVRAWFETIRQVEGGRPDVMAGGRTVKSGPRHPGQIVPRSEWFRGPKGPSSAAGNWQITLTNWRKWAPVLGLDNWSDPNQQMMVALALFVEGGGDVSLLNGDMRGALKASSPWAATPLSHLPGHKPLTSQKFVERYQGLVNGGGSSLGPAKLPPVPVTIVGSDAGDVPADAERFVKRDEYSTEFGGMVSVARSQADWNAIDQERARVRQSLTGLSGAVESVRTDLSGVTLSLVELPQSAMGAGFGMRLVEEQGRATAKGMGETAVNWAKLVMGSADKLSQYMSAMGQVAGMVPGQQVGKKRGFFSKMLGFAAPFLSFIPGVGPILSTLAGIGSSVLGGDYGSAFTQGVAGFSSGGAFRRSSSSSGSSTAGGTTSYPGAGLEPRANGGPVRKGRAYTVGDRGPRQYWEVFEPETDGYVYPSVDAYEGSRRGGSAGGGHKGGGVMGGALASVLNKMEAHFARLDAVSMDHVYTTGARRNPGATTDSFMRGASRDPKVIEWMERRRAA